MMIQEQELEIIQKIKNIKAFSFRDRKQEQRKKKLFKIICYQKDLKHKLRHQYILKCKTFRALMDYAILSNKFSQRISHFYYKLLLQKHFTAMKNYQELVRHQKMKQLNIIKLHRFFKMLKSQKCQKNIQIKQNQRKYQSPKHQQIKFQKELKSPFKNIGEALLGSHQSLRQSKQSFADSLKGSKISIQRKYVPVRQVPQLPSFQNKVLGSQISQLREENDSAELRDCTIHQSNRQTKDEKITKMQSKQFNFRKVNEQTSIALKMIEISELSQIFGSLKKIGLKANAKDGQNYLQNSKNTLKQIISIRNK